MKMNRKLFTALVTLLIFGMLAGCTKKEDPAIAELKAQMQAMQAELDKTKNGNDTPEEIAKQEQKAETVTATTTQTVIPVNANKTSGNWSINNDHLTINNGVTNIEKGTFFKNESITDITIPDSVISIESEAFLGAFGLKNLTLGNGVTIIESAAFSACEQLQSITIPKSVKELKKGAFVPARKLKLVTFEGDGVILDYGFDIRGVEYGPFPGNLHKVYSGKGTYIRTGQTNEYDGFGGSWTKQ